MVDEEEESNSKYSNWKNNDRPQATEQTIYTDRRTHPHFFGLRKAKKTECGYMWRK